MPSWPAVCRQEVLLTVLDSRDPGFLADYIAQNIALRYDRQAGASWRNCCPFARLRKLNGFLVRENNVLGFEHEMESKVRDQLRPAPSGTMILRDPDPGPPERAGGGR